MSKQPPLDRDIEKLKEPFKTKMKMLFKKCPQIFGTEFFRSAELQNYYYTNKPGSTDKDGYKNLSMHQKGLAADIAFLGSELYPVNHQKWREVADVAKELGIDWGYDLWFYRYGFIDKPHFQCNGQPINNNIMPENDYFEIMDKHVQKKVLDSHTGESTLTEGQIKALLEVFWMKAKKDLVDEIADEIVKRLKD